LPFTVASFTTHTTTPPCFDTRYNSFASASKFQSNPLYVRRLSYGGEVTVKSIHSSGNSRNTSTLSLHIILLIYSLIFANLSPPFRYFFCFSLDIRPSIAYNIIKKRN